VRKKKKKRVLVFFHIFLAFRSRRVASRLVLSCLEDTIKAYK
jgi:hypothetical protein